MSRGNSDPRPGRKLTVEECWPLSIAELQKFDGRDLLGDELQRVIFTISSGKLAVRCTLERTVPDRRTIQIDDAGSGVRFPGQSNLLIATVPNYGGLRWWFKCCDCLRRATKLYLPPAGGWFSCRRCHGLSYRSSQENHRPNAMWCLCAARSGVDPRESLREVRRKARRGDYRDGILIS